MANQSTKKSGSKAQGKPQKANKSAAKKRVSQKPNSSANRSWLKHQFRRLVLVAILLLAIPYFFVLLYAVQFVKPISTLMVYQWVKGVEVERIWVDRDEISNAMQFSAVAAEDANFCSHYGVEFAPLRRQLLRALSGKSARGASTIPMQTVKNLFLWHGRSHLRKAYEIPLAMWADLVWSKERMLEIYLNIVELGPGIFGVEEAGLKYFRTSAVNLGWKHSSLIATSLPNPIARNPARPSGGHASLARKIRRRAGASGPYIACLKEG